MKGLGRARRQPRADRQGAPCARRPGRRARGRGQDIKVYQPYANIPDFEHALVEGLRGNARQLVEAAILGYGIGNNASPMTIVETGRVGGGRRAEIGTTTTATGEDPATTASSTTARARRSASSRSASGGQIRIIGGALPTPTETHDHRYGLRDYAPTYSGLFILENAIEHDVEALGIDPPPPPPPPERRQAGQGAEAAPNPHKPPKSWTPTPTRAAARRGRP